MTNSTSPAPADHTDEAAEPVGPGGHGLPPVLYVPVEATGGVPVTLTGRTMGDEALDVAVVMLPTADGRRGLPVYTAMDRLLDQWGTGHPWVVILTATLEEIEAQQPFDALLVDLEVPQDLRID